MTDIATRTIYQEQYLAMKRCRYGTMLFNIKDTYVGRSFDLYGEFSELEVRMMAQILKPGMIAIDVGANIGAHTVFMAGAVTRSGAVVAFEPQRILHQMLCANLALNAIGNTVALHAASGAEPGAIMVPRVNYGAGGNFGGIEIGKTDDGETVPVTTIDQLGLGACHFIKVDAEGMELDVLQGAAATIAKFQPLMYVENDRREKSAALIGHLLGLDFRLYWHFPRLFNPNNFFENPDNVFADIISRNMVCVPRARQLTIQDMVEITSVDETW